jgi:Ala-tRNA(Pro) deacylase
MIAESLRRYLDAHHAHYHVHEHDVRFTAAETAQVTHVPGHQFAKTVLLRVLDRPPGRYALAVLPAHEEVDLGRLHTIIGFPVELAAEDEFQRVFPGFELGAAPPIGELAVQDVPLLVDTCLSQGPGIAFNGGTHTDVVEMPWHEYTRLAAMRLVDYGRKPAPPSPTSRSS